MKFYDTLRLSGFADEISDDFETQIQSLTKLNMKFIELRGISGRNIIFHEDSKIVEIKKCLDNAGISVSALATPIGKIQIDDDFEPHFEIFKRAVEIAKVMNTKYIRIFSFYVAKDIQKGRRVDTRDKVFDRIARMVNYAQKSDVVLLHENEKGIYGEGAKECRLLMDAFAGKAFRALFDFANFVQVGQDTIEAYEMLKDYIEYIHVKDALSDSGKVVLAGLGNGNIGYLLKQIMTSGYNGFVSLEPHLCNFSGFSELEKSHVTFQNIEPHSSSFGAFLLAHEALLNLLR